MASPIGPGGVGRNTSSQRDKDRQAARANGGTTGWGAGSVGNNGMFGTKRIQAAQQAPLASIPGMAGNGKKTEGDNKPGEDAISQAQAAIPNKPLTDVEKALLEARRQRALLGPGVDIASTILGAMPTPVPFGMAFQAGNMMGKYAEDAAAANPNNFTGNPSTGEVKSKSGPLTSNRAQDLPSNKANMTNASADENDKEEKRKKQRPLPTLLGASANPVGTMTNPVMIT